MSATPLFWAIAAMLTAAVLALVLRPLLAPGRRCVDGGFRASSLAVHRSRLEELESQHALGELDDHGLAVAKDEVLAELQGDLEEPRTPRAVPARATRARALALMIGLMTPVLAVALYLGLGNPGSLQAPEPAPGAGAAGQDPRIPHSVAAMVLRLEERLAGDLVAEAVVVPTASPRPVMLVLDRVIE